jgi:hypothetical protein
VTNHEQAAFNIMRFREAGLIDIFMRMFKEEADTLCIGFAPTLMVILRSIMTDPPHLADLQVPSILPSRCALSRSVSLNQRRLCV